MEERLHRTLREVMLNHNNDYGFDVHATLLQSPDVPNLSIVIPYYESKHITLVIRYLYTGIVKVQQEHPEWQFEVIVIDDGSMNRADRIFNPQEYHNLAVTTLQSNRGRTEARNVGLRQARFPVVLFMDADIIVSDDVILNHLKVQVAEGIAGRCITVGFFATVAPADPFLTQPLTNNAIRSKLNDFRLSCVYQSSWIGCEEDKQFIGRMFEIVRETNGFRNWPIGSFFGPWILSNMVLGGFFMVDREAAFEVNGFDRSFVGYGFTETSLPTKLIARYSHYVVPVIEGVCLHIDDESEWPSRSEKNALFREKHAQYFNRYLELTCEEAIHG
ncbi:MAG: hypothetical protein COU90_00685 [Candidatus Ryanbacteria bacterium CG10_big_fil_rev_8_21_14_0_10_43_42]|uniref:Glycosyltransferase 2-like domain-containing protein n=1 Tax=Candidatus Ryanbacteria bacterium CG10_big_fil_rev_8_21_14_0_10_43_42 TaxID=1974864 RepID=A0A2M8KXX2_9BACT|nr:MAG: hypothetical protein COU90_00685 [Candidatus Ryanbacteria bacterium CG10_big_fil_rev_8_21_14_0_10_43_42]